MTEAFLCRGTDTLTVPLGSASTPPRQGFLSPTQVQSQSWAGRGEAVLGSPRGPLGQALAMSLVLPSGINVTNTNGNTHHRPSTVLTASDTAAP